MTEARTEKPRIGFIGVGFMGHGMAKNLIEKGHAMQVIGNRNRQPVEDLLTRGATEADVVLDDGRTVVRVDDDLADLILHCHSLCSRFIPVD